MRRLIAFIIFLGILGLVLYKVKEVQRTKSLEMEKAAQEHFERQIEFDIAEADEGSTIPLSARQMPFTTETLTLAPDREKHLWDDLSTPTEILTTGAGEIRGRVLEPDEKPIPDAEIFLLAYRAEKEVFTQRVLSDDAGEYAFTMLPGGAYELRAFHSYYAPTAKTGIQLEPDQMLEDIDIILSAGLSLTGRVVDAQKKPISRADVSVDKKITRIGPTRNIPVTVTFKCAEDISGVDGSFTLEQIPPGDIILFARKIGYTETTLPLTISENATPSPLTLILKEAAEIGGIVVDSEDVPIKGAEIKAVSYTTIDGATHDISDDKALVTVTDENGRFILTEALSGAMYTLKVKAVDFPETLFPGIKSSTDSNKLVLHSGGSIMGNVTFLADGKPASGIRVLAKRKDERSPFSAASHTLESGQYTLNDLPAGTYDVGIDSDTFTSTEQKNIKLETNKNIGGVDFTIYPGLQIEGEVVDYISKTGIAGAVVYLEGEVSGGGSRKEKVPSSNDGRFVFTNLPEGLYELYAEAEGYLSRKAKDDRKEILLKVGEEGYFINIVLYRGGEITGVVRTPDHAPVDFAYVHAFQPRGARGRIDTKNLHTTTGVAGTFSLSGIDVSSAVELVVSAQVDGFAPAVSEPILLTPAYPSTNVTVTLPKSAAIKGKVLEGKSEGAPLSDVHISLYNQTFAGDGLYKKPETRSDAGGKFFFSNLTPGNITLSVQKQGYVNASKSVTIDEGETQEVEIIMHPGFSIAGSVYDDLGQPLEDVQVTARPEAEAIGTASAKTNALGVFLITKIGEGTYTLDAQFKKSTPQGTQSYRRRIRNVPSGTDGVQIIFPLNAELTGRVYDAVTNDPIEGFSVRGKGTVELDNEGNTTNFRIATKKYFETSGEFSCESLPTGEYELTFEGAGFIPRSQAGISIKSPGKKDLGTIILYRGGTITGSILSDLTEEPVSRVKGTLDKGPSRVAYSNADGRITFGNLEDGIYVLTLTHRHYIERTIPDIVVTVEEITDLGMVYLEPGATIDGKVKDVEGNAMDGVQIEVRSQEKTHKATTDNFGYYIVDGVKQGTVEVVASKTVQELELLKTKTIEVSPDIHYEVNFTFDLVNSLEGVLIADQYLLANPTIHLYYIGEGMQISEEMKWTISPRVDLTFGVESMMKGKYFFIAEGKPVESFEPVRLLPITRGYQLVNLSGAVFDVRVYFGNASVSGVVIREPSGIPQKNAKITLAREPEVRIKTPATFDKFAFTTTSESNGEFFLYPLPAGDYDLYLDSTFKQQVYVTDGQKISGLIITANQ